MDKIKKYSQILKIALEEQTKTPFANNPTLKEHLVINKDETEFILLTIGWKGAEFVHGITVHAAIKNGKVSFYANNTDIDFGEQLSRKGIPKSDMVIEFVDPIERDAEYAGAY